MTERIRPDTINGCGITYQMAEHAWARESDRCITTLSRSQGIAYWKNCTPRVLHSLAAKECARGLPGYGATGDLAAWAIENPEHPELAKLDELEQPEPDPQIGVSRGIMQSLYDRIDQFNSTLRRAKDHAAADAIWELQHGR